MMGRTAAVGWAVGLLAGIRPGQSPTFAVVRPIGGWVIDMGRFEPIYGAKQAVEDTPYEEETHIFAQIGKE